MFQEIGFLNPDIKVGKHEVQLGGNSRNLIRNVVIMMVRGTFDQTTIVEKFITV